MENKRYEIIKFLSTLKVELRDDFLQKITHYLKLLHGDLLHHFPDATDRACIIDPFSADPSDLPVGTGE